MNTLFDNSPLPRGPQVRGRTPMQVAGSDRPAPHSGGSTSAAAAREIRGEAKTQRRQVLAYLIGRGQDGATDEEMQRDLEMPGNTQRPRRSELEQLRLIEAKVEHGFANDRHPEGIHSVTRMTSSGRQAQVWVVTTAGRATANPTTERGAA